MGCFNGSQCSSYINGVLWLRRGAQQTSLAAVKLNTMNSLKFNVMNSDLKGSK